MSSKLSASPRTEQTAITRTSSSRCSTFHPQRGSSIAASSLIRASSMGLSSVGKGRAFSRSGRRDWGPDLVRHPSYEASAVKRGLPRDRSGAELLLVEDGRCPSNLVSGRIGRSGTTIPGIREGQLRGGGTILSSGTRTGPSAGPEEVLCEAAEIASG